MSKRILYIDLLNIIACISVVALHVNGIVHTYSNTFAWKTSLIIECICYFAVPLFLMLTGANLLGYKEKYDTKTFLKKRFFKVGIPFFIWSIFAFCFNLYITKDLVVKDLSISGILNIFLHNEEMYIYYFMTLIIGIYLTIPTLSPLAKDENKGLLKYTIIIMFISIALIPNILNLIKVEWNYELSIQLGKYLLFVLLGYYLKKYDIKRKHRYIIYFIALIGIFLRFFYTLFFSQNTGILNEDLKGYTQWHTVFLTMSIFLLIKNLHINKYKDNEKIKKVIRTISNASFGIYLIHIFVMRFIIFIFKINEMSSLWRTLGIFMIYCISLLIVLVMKKLPIIKKIVP